jgi:hypothetical protein
MKFQASVLCLLATGAAAFSPRQSFVTRNSGLVVPTAEDESSNSPLWRPPKMVAGGAERAHGQEYYEGE